MDWYLLKEGQGRFEGLIVINRIHYSDVNKVDEALKTEKNLKNGQSTDSEVKSAENDEISIEEVEKPEENIEETKKDDSADGTSI